MQVLEQKRWIKDVRLPYYGGQNKIRIGFHVHKNAPK